MAKQRIPQELLINLAKAGDQSLTDLVIGLGQRKSKSELFPEENLPHEEKGYSLENYPIEENGGGFRLVILICLLG